MWALATFFNASLSVLNLGVLPVYGNGGTIANSNSVLAVMGRVSAGHWLELWVSVDAFIVLSGAVLTSYVGITGNKKKHCIVTNI